MRRRVLLSLVSCAVLAASTAAAESGELLYSTEGNRLRRTDVDTLDAPRPTEEVLIQRAGQGPGAHGNPGRDVNGMICRLPDGSGRFVLGEDTDQPSPPPGWGVFEADGRQVGKLTATYQVAGAEPFGCAFDVDPDHPAESVLYTTSVGAQGFGTANGQLIRWLPPYDRFPGPPGAYPDTDAPSDHFCKIAIDLGTAGAPLVDAQGRIWVAESSGLKVERFTLPAGRSLDPADGAAGGCGDVDPQGSPLVDEAIRTAPGFRETLISTSPDLPTFSGLALAPGGASVYVASVLSGKIGEFDLDGNPIRLVVDHDRPLFELPSPWGNPQGLAVGADGTLYYADLDLQGELPDVGPGPDGKVRRVRFDAGGAPLPPEIVRDGLAFPDGVAIFPGDLERAEWPTLAGSGARLFHQPAETILTRDNVADVAVRFTVPTGAVVTASPSVALVDVPGEGLTRLVYFLSWDLHLYAVRVEDGSVLWKVATEDQPGASFPATASVHVERIDHRDRVFVGQGEIFHAFDAATGDEVWRFTAGTGCRDAAGEPPGLCGFAGERNEIESSAVVADGKVFFGMDVNDVATGKGGIYALDARDGRLAWFFDLESGQTCRPLAGDDVRAYDPYHGEAELGLPAGFLATRPGCDHPRTPNGCGNVWSSPALDSERGALFLATSNCDTPVDPATGLPEPMPPFDEAIVSLTTDGDVRWVWRPREGDREDLAFGAAPQLFTITAPVGGVPTEVPVVGVGGKDGTYYVLDRDGVNRTTGVAWGDHPASHLPADLPYWSTQVVPGGDIGGILATAAADGDSRRIFFTTAPGDSDANAPPGPPQQPTTHALDMDTGAVVWQTDLAPTAVGSFSATSSIPGVVMAGTAVFALLRFHAADDGSLLHLFNLGNLAMGSAPTAVDGTLLVGSGIGTRTSTGSGPSDFAANTPSPLTALCVPGTAGCAACNDGEDNDGDGLVDAAQDPGCVDDRDASEVRGDLDLDGDVDLRDRDLFFAAFGRVPGEVGFRHAADLAPEGAPDDVIGLADYQAWVDADLAANGPRPPACGLLGPEALGVLLAVRGLRGRVAAARRARTRG